MNGAGGHDNMAPVGRASSSSVESSNPESSAFKGEEAGAGRKESLPLATRMASPRP